MSAFQRKYNTATVAATHITIPIVKAGVNDFAVAADWTPAAGDVKISKDSGAAANIGTLPIYQTNEGWEFVFTGAELSAKRISILIVDSATKAIEDQFFIIETFGNAAAMLIQDISAAQYDANLTQIEGTSQSATDLKDFADAGYDPATNSVEQVKVNDDMRGTDGVDTATMRGTDGANTVVPMTNALSQTEHDASQSLISALNDLSKTDVANSFKDTDVASTNPAAGSLFENVVGSTTVDELQERASITSGVISKTIAGKTQKYIVLYTEDGAAAGTRNFQKELLGALIGGFDETTAAKRQYLPIFGFYQEDGAGAITEINGIAADLGVNATTDLAGASWTGATDESTAGAGYTMILPFVDGYTAPTSNSDLRIIYPRAIGQAALDSSAMTDWTSPEKEQIRHRINIDGTQTAPSVEGGGAGKIAGPNADLTLKSIAVVQTDADSPAVSYTGKGTGAGLFSTSDATGDGIHAQGGATGGGGHGINAEGEGTGGTGLRAIGNGAGRGIQAVGGANGAGIEGLGGGSKAGISTLGGDTGGPGILAAGDSGAPGFKALGSGAGAGILASGDQAGGTGHGIHAKSGSGANGDGARFESISTGLAHGLKLIGGTTGAALRAEAQDGNGIEGRGGEQGHGIIGIGDGTGDGVAGESGLGATGSGMRMEAKSTNGHGMELIKTGTGIDLKATDHGDGIWESGITGLVTLADNAANKDIIELGTDQALDAANVALTSIPNSETGSIRQWIQLAISILKLKKEETAASQTIFKEDNSTTFATRAITVTPTKVTVGKLT